MKAYRRDKYIAYGKYTTVFERIVRWTQGNMMFISNKIIDEIVTYIQQEKFDVVFIEDRGWFQSCGLYYPQGYRERVQRGDR